jgi:hypothetical protein
VAFQVRLRIVEHTPERLVLSVRPHGVPTAMLSLGFVVVIAVCLAWSSVVRTGSYGAIGYAAGAVAAACIFYAHVLAPRRAVLDVATNSLSVPDDRSASSRLLGLRRAYRFDLLRSATVSRDHATFHTPYALLLKGDGGETLSILEAGTESEARAAATLVEEILRVRGLTPNQPV